MERVNSKYITLANGKLCYKATLFTGIKYSNFSEGAGYVEQEIIEGVPNGVYKRFYESGQLCKEFHTETNADKSLDPILWKTFKFSTFYESGQLCEQGELIEYLLVEKYKCFYEDGRSFIVADFRINEISGYGTCFYRSGNTAQKGNINNWAFAMKVRERVNRSTPSDIGPLTGRPFSMPYGLPHSDQYLSERLYDTLNNEFDFAPYPRLLQNFESWNESGGQITEIIDYVKTCYNKHNEVILVESCNSNLEKHGQSCKYSFGKITEIESYFNGNLNGLYLKFNYNGFISIRGEYLKGERVGSWDYYDEKGLLLQ